MPQALLAKAFRGELVAQLPTDLPAGSNGEFFCSDVYHYEVFKSEAEAVKREKFFKSGHGREWLKQMGKENRLRQAGGDARDLLEQISRAKAGLEKGGRTKKMNEKLGGEDGGRRRGRVRKELF